MCMDLDMHGTYTYHVTYVESEVRVPLGLGEFPLAPMKTSTHAST